jgi:hypothetical protein
VSSALQKPGPSRYHYSCSTSQSSLLRTTLTSPDSPQWTKQRPQPNIPGSISLVHPNDIHSHLILSSPTAYAPPHHSHSLSGPGFPSDSIGDGPPKTRITRSSQQQPPTTSLHELDPPRGSTRSTHSKGALRLKHHQELLLAIDESHSQLYQAHQVANQPSDVNIWLRNSIIEHFPMQLTVPAICGGDDYFRTDNTGLLSPGASHAPLPPEASGPDRTSARLLYSF